MFKRGNIVSFKCGFWGDANSPQTGRLGVIEYSYDEKYGNGEIGGGYSVLDKETGGSSAWWNEEYLEFVSEGSEDEIKKCKEIANTIKERNENLDYIKSEILKGNLNLSGSSILKLFHEIEYISAFERDGEYYALYSDWEALSPIFVALFNKQYDIMVKSMNVFKEEYRDSYKEKAINFYNRVNQLNQRFVGVLKGVIRVVKQYTVENAYTGNKKVSRYTDGELEFYEVMSYWEIKGYCSALESMGYTKAYDVEKYKKELDEAEEEYNWAAKRYSMAKENPLVKRK